MKPVLSPQALWLLGLFALISLPVAAAECSATSGRNRVALLELYTSEGCSSCPPADRWLSGLAAAGYAGDRVIPLALHVDYWDTIGWKDRFAKPGFSARQREMAGLGHAGFVYTPQVMLNGRDYLGVGNPARFAADIAAINRNPARANIQLTLSQPGADSLEVSAAAQAGKQDSPLLYVALYENNLNTAVRAGENGGASLHHDYVVREWLGPYPIDKTTTPWRHKLRLDPEWKSPEMGVAAFVQSRASGEVLQAMALKLCEDGRH
ncbi:MAG TPA: DUF1223 domain-containing protein [Methylophilaceae bacterium]|nr:DUF1223 domain-containing protein [Methylophilaceae bacterium]